MQVLPDPNNNCMWDECHAGEGTCDAGHRDAESRVVWGGHAAAAAATWKRP